MNLNVTINYSLDANIKQTAALWLLPVDTRHLTAKADRESWDYTKQYNKNMSANLRAPG